MSDRPTPARWRPYPAYKDSGVPWLGEIPAHWDVKRLKCAAGINQDTLPETTDPGYGISYLDITNVEAGGGIVSAGDMQFADAPSRARRCVRNGDTIISTVRTYLKAIAFMDSPPPNRVVSTGFAVLRPSASLYPRFLWRMVQSDVFVQAVVSHSEGVGYPAIAPTELAMLPVWLPPLPEQRAIAAFLDRETAHIDALLAKKERLLRLLAEKRTALISHAVTRGLDASAPLKESGVPWLGRIPERWEMKRLKFLTSFVTSGSRGWAQHYADDGPLFLRIGNLSRISIDLDLGDVQRVMPPASSEVERTRVMNHDVLVSITAYIGSIGIVTESIGEAYVNQHIALARPRQHTVFPRWMAYCLLSWVGQSQFDSLLYGGTKEGLGLDDVRNLFLLMPPVREQHAIAAFLDRETAKLDALAAKVGEGMERLREYWAALIAAAVTGKVDVRGSQRI